MINPDITLLIQMCVVVALYIILNKMFFKPIAKHLDKRREYVDVTTQAREEKKESVIKLVEKYERAICEAQKEAVAHREEIKKEGLAKERELLEIAHKEHADAIHEVKLKAKEEYEKAQKEIDDHVKNLSRNVAEKILKRKIQ
jgi:F-type H+-transporting ATPase subunit b